MLHRLSLTGRELSRSGRSPKTYGLRLLVAILALTIGAFAAFLVFIDTLEPELLAAALGEFMTVACLVFQFTVVAAVAPFLTVGLIAEEREGDTLSLLMMADMRCVDIYMAKFVSAFLQVEMLLFSTLPILAAAAFFGGVSVPIVTTQVVMLSVTAAFVCALGLLCSALVKSARQALFLFIVLGTVWLGATLAIDARLVYKLYPYRVDPFFGIVEVHTFTTMRFLALYLGTYAGACLLVSAAVVMLLPRLIYGRRKAPRFRTAARYPWGKGFLRMNQMAQLFAGNAGGADFNALSRFTRFFVVGVFIAAGAVSFFGWIFVTLALALHVSTSMFSAQRRGLLPDMLVTPVPEAKLARAIFHANITRTLLFAPGIAAAEFSVFFLVAVSTHSMMVAGPSGGTMAYLAIPVLLVLAPARYISLVALTCAFATERRHPLWQGLRGMLSASGLAAATYGLFYAWIFLELPWPESEAGGLLFGSCFVFFAAAICVAAAWWGYRRFAQALWGRLPVRRSLPFNPRSTPPEPASAT
ncbi:MAG: hypothetical protein GY851_05550 [bacterium]|nr:hypothetical protein [bacterium]